MDWKKPAPWIALASAALVVWLVWLDRGSTSPGALSSVHGQVDELAGDDCAQCHGRPAAPDMASACSHCHADIAEQLVRATGFHGTLHAGSGGVPGALDPARCGACHSEHHGERFPIVNAQSFTLAGVPDALLYDHARLGFELTGRHADLACADCHPLALTEVLKPGEHRYLGRSQACSTCHEDVHAGALPDCAACHGQELPFARVASFVHTDAFPLTGTHAISGCVDCHPKDTPFAIEAARASPGASEPGKTPRACADCHPSPHTLAFAAASARTRGIEPDAACAACHPTDHASFEDASGTLSRAEHAATGFALEAPHDQAACEDCHARGGRADAAVERTTFASFRRTYPGRDSTDCGACHGDPHGGQFTTGAFAAAACTACHARAHFAPPAFDLALHDRTAFPLTGSHAAVGCVLCHREVETVLVRGEQRTARTFHGTPAACAACHADVHAGSFDRPGQPATFDGHSDCGRCHTTESFRGAAKGFDHARWTGFVLDGAHARAACTTCHAPDPAPDGTGRTLGRVRDRFDGDPARCSTCHADVHRGEFDRAGLPAAVDGRAECARCHVTESFRAGSTSFDHGRWTGFELAGAHAHAACGACHPRAAVADTQGRSFGRCAVKGVDAERSCTSCHTDVHAGAFDRAGVPAIVDGRAGCVRCHGQDRFDVDVQAFDHARWTGFALEGAHARLECASCHAPVAAADGHGEVIGLARGPSCADCHVDPHAAQFAEQGRTDCARCHTLGTNFRALAFDHQRDSRFALDATHAKLACATCHRQAPLPDGTQAVRYKPLGTTCGDCHDPRGPKPR